MLGTFSKVSGQCPAIGNNDDEGDSDGVSVTQGKSTRSRKLKLSTIERNK